jgi:hypothetical protein
MVRRTHPRLHTVKWIERKGTDWSDPFVPLDGGKPNELLGCAGWMPDGQHMVVQDAERTMIAILPLKGGERRVIYEVQPGENRPLPIWVRVDAKTGDIIFRDWTSVWIFKAGSSEPQQIAQFDENLLRPTRIEMDATRDRIYFSLGDPQGDLVTAELVGVAKKRRD